MKETDIRAVTDFRVLQEAYEILGDPTRLTAATDSAVSAGDEIQRQIYVAEFLSKAMKQRSKSK